MVTGKGEKKRGKRGKECGFWEIWWISSRNRLVRDKIYLEKREEREKQQRGKHLAKFNAEKQSLRLLFPPHFHSINVLSKLIYVLLSFLGIHIYISTKSRLLSCIHQNNQISKLGIGLFSFSALEGRREADHRVRTPWIKRRRMEGVFICRFQS